MSSSIMYFNCDDNALLLRKFELEGFSKNRMEREYLNHLQLLKNYINKEEISFLE